MARPIAEVYQELLRPGQTPFNAHRAATTADIPNSTTPYRDMNTTVPPLPNDPRSNCDPTRGCPLPNCGNTSTGKSGDQNALAGTPSARFPPWKRVLDLCFVILTAWIWLPLMLLITCM